MDVSSTMAAPAQTSATHVSPLRAAQVSSGIDASSFVTSFADVLEASLQQSADSLQQSSHGVVADTKSQAKATSKKEDSAPASPGNPNPALAAVFSPMLVPALLSGPAELQTRAPAVSPDSESSTSDIGAKQAPAAAQKYLPSENEITAPANSLPTSTDLRGNAAVQPTVSVAPRLDNQRFSPTVPSVSAPVTSAAAPYSSLPSSSNGNLSSTSQVSATAETVSSPMSAPPIEPTGESLPASSSVATINSEDATNGATADSATPNPSGVIQDLAPTILAPDTFSPVGSSTQISLPQAVKTDESAPATPPRTSQETPLAQQKTESYEDMLVSDLESQMALPQSAAAAGAPSVAPTGAPSDASAALTTSVSVSSPRATETSNASLEKASKETRSTSSPVPENAPVANDHALAIAALHSYFARQLQHFDNGSVSIVHNPPPAITALASVPPSQSQDSSSVDDVSSPNSLTSLPLPAAQLSLSAATDVTTPRTAPATAPSNGLDAPLATSSRDAKNGKMFASNPISMIAGTSSGSLNQASGLTASAAPAAVTQVSEIASSGKSSTSSGNTTLPHGAAQNSTSNETPDDGPELSPAMHAWNGGENLQADLTRTPHIVEKLGQSEVNIAMQADALGSVQVRAHLAGDQVGAAITVEHHDLHTMLSNDLPALHQALSQRELRVTNLSVHQVFSSGDAGIGGGKGQQQPQDGTTQRAIPFMQSPPEFSAPLNFSTSADSSESRGILDSQGRLSVRA